LGLPASSSPDPSSRQLRFWLALWCAGSLGMLGFGLYLQEAFGLEPCPMCIVQRYVLLLVALAAGVGAVLRSPGAARWTGAVLVLLALFGAFVAARQSWLQWFPPEVYTCGRDLYGMIESFPLKRVIPMVFRGSGDCTKVDWAFLGLSIANWSFLYFLASAFFGGWLAWRRR
jgi:protein dithiol:quinone oxidoreductase